MANAAPQHPAQLRELLDRGTAAGSWRLDPAHSQFAFAVKHFWGAVTVRGSFEQLSGEANVAADGTVTGQLSVDAASVNTKNKKRDEHLRSADFFDAERHPRITIAISSAEPAGPATLTCRGTLEAAGHVEPIEFTAHVDDPSTDAVILHVKLTIDRTSYAMTWSPLAMASKIVHATAVARFVRS